MLDGIAAARDAGLAPVKLNCVVQRGVNEDGLLDLVAFARREGLGLRCIEYMDVGETNGWRMADVVSGEEILARVRRVYPLLEEAPDPTAVARTYRFADGNGDLGVITSVSRPFCGDCTRARTRRRRQALHVPVRDRRRRPARTHAFGCRRRRAPSHRRRTLEAARRSLLRVARARHRRGRTHRDVVHRRLTDG